MVEMAVRQQQPVKPAEAGAGPQKLPLRAFPAIDQDTVAGRLDEQPRMVTVGRWDAGRSAQEVRSNMVGLAFIDGSGLPQDV